MRAGATKAFGCLIIILSYVRACKSRDPDQIGSMAFLLLAIIKRGLSDGQKCPMSRPHSLLITHALVQEYGIALAEVARHVGVCTSAVSKMPRKAAI